MNEPSLLDELQSTLQVLDQQAARHQEAIAYERATQRQAFLHLLLEDLLAEVTALSAVRDILKEVCNDVPATTLWEETRRQLNEAPKVFHSPGQALMADTIALLQLIYYTSSVSAACRERRYHLMRGLQSWHQEESAPPLSGPIRCLLQLAPDTGASETLRALRKSERSA